ncbi:class I SAM-dependent methyltransferase [Sinanaerobacter chloroacetimidivorans]|uniref:SAM-dependent methyltransferase n=1 Tax=Sinanaerobacter chloroacetimidivorans TaxID=2818044 RepID=A0A8J7W472_9FIRM|nr:SAM-dependent methyltransferase [Sinanaerobacter chloroacetimidivorans]MBR0598771.1 SAM-dependent methyltransferase [Sinanaerobacter chloroacetimidivorans]
MEKIILLLKEILSNQTLVKAVFSGLRNKSVPYQKAVIRPILLNGSYYCQIEYHYKNKVTHENLSPEKCLEVSKNLIQDSFKQVNLFSSEGDYQILAAKPHLPRILKKPPSKGLPSLDHNQAKQYLIPDDIPCDFLIRLGVMDQEGHVIQKHYSKFRQINRFLDIVSDVLAYLPDPAKDAKAIRIVDFGCGKAYLTFALYYYLKIMLNKNVEIIGLDLKEDVIEFCNIVAADLNYQELKFLKGDIADYTGNDPADMVVTLHACDTATDFALMKAVKWNASIILSVPCCQHELFHQLENNFHLPIMKHGILKERFSSILTDGLRSLKLEEVGYDVALVEFTSLEHTSKNIMIRAVKTGKEKKSSGEEFRQLSEYWNVNPTISQLNK